MAQTKMVARMVSDQRQRQMRQQQQQQQPVAHRRIRSGA